MEKVPTPVEVLANQRIVNELRANFDAMMARLKPEVEPAVSYSVRAEKAR